MKARAPVLGGNFGVWGGMFSTFDCAIKGIRKKEDPYNAILAGFFTGGALAVRGGLKAARNSAIACGCLLAVIEGVGIGFQRMMAENTRLDDNSFFNGQFGKILAEPNGKPMLEWINTIPNNGLIRYLSLLNHERILMTNAKGLSEVLVQKNYEFIKPDAVRTGLGRVLGEGVLVAEGEEHKTQRKSLSPAFAYRHIKELYPTFWLKSRELVQALSSLVKEELLKEGDEKGAPVVHMGSWLSRATLDIIGVAGLFMPIWLIRLLPLKRNAEIAEAVKSVRSVSRRLIQAKQQKMNEKAARVDKDILSVAIESGGFSEENLVDQLMTFLAAGHETTASAMTWALYALCKHQDMQTRLREEVRANLPSIDDESVSMSAEILDRLPYLHAVCNEVLRVHAPVAMTRREAAVDTTLLGHFVPKGTSVFLSPAAVNMSIELWGQDALEFKPERWMAPGKANSGGATSNYANLTFLHGPRSCIGQQFAKAEFACLLAAVVGRFEMELLDKDAPHEIQTGVTSRPKGGMELRTRIVEGW
ncbi:hypothetical protein MMC13_006430 [Lambiella insularis]|nr:hypothetical protein [Lambiella insularis]